MDKAIKITKTHTICHLIAVHGPSTKAFLLKEADRLEGRYHRRLANGCYFAPAVSKGRKPTGSHQSSLLYKGLIKQVGIQDGAAMYGLTVLGLKSAQQYRKAISA
jgi:hypothetical protein